MAAVELSLDRDWIRYRISSFYSSGDNNPRNGRANGFDCDCGFAELCGAVCQLLEPGGQFRLLGFGSFIDGRMGSLLPNMRFEQERGTSEFCEPRNLSGECGNGYLISRLN